MSSTGDCRGCEGIQVLTPQPIFNRAALEQLRYRVGTHASFFESMLARISEIQRRPEDPGATAAAARALEELTTRKPDDPSIALLDAWAAVASVLSFYQERIANEAFLRTATERRSVEELARLVGYELRPGLASSVLMAFEVDDRSDDVVIPKGTPIKSTPVPGSDTQPQTFETSEDFIGHPRWNVLRPRLTQPIDKPSARGDLYFQGTGLRIQPNDLLAVSPESGDIPIPLTVISVREFNDTQRPTTIVTVLTDRIVDEVAEKMSEFLDRSDLKSLLKPAYLDELGERLRSHLNAARRRLRVERLAGADLYLEESLVRKDLLNATATTDTLGFEAESMVRWYDDNLPAFAFDATNATYTGLRTEYLNLHATAVSTAIAWSSLLDGLLAPISTPAAYASRVADTWKTIDSFAHVDEPKPYVYLGLNPVQTAAAANDRICPQPVALDGPPPSDFTFNRVRVTAQATGGINVSAGSAIAVGAMDALAAKVQDAIAQVKLGGVNNAYNFVFLKVFGRKTTGGEVTLATGIQPIRNLGATAPPTDFGDLEYDKAVLASGTNPRIDPDFQLDTTATTTYRIQSAVAIGSAQIEKGGTPWNGATMIPAKDIDEEIKNLELANFTPFQGRVVVLFTFTPMTAGVKPIAFALRTVVVGHPGSATKVRARVCRFLGELSDLSQATPDLVELTRYRDDLNNLVIAKLQILAAPAGPTDERLISELMAESVGIAVGTALDGVRHELLSAPDLAYRNNKLQPAWGIMRRNSGADNAGQGTLVAHELALLTDNAVAFIRQQLQPPDLPPTLASVPDYPPQASAKYFDERLKDVQGRLNSQKTDYKTLIDTINDLAKAIMRLLHVRRDEFLEALKEIQDNEMPKFGNVTSGTDAAEVKRQIEEEFQATPTTTALARLAALNGLIDSPPPITAAKIVANDTTITKLITLFKEHIKKVREELSSLNSIQREVATAITDEWLALFALNEGQAIPGGSTATNAQDLVQTIAASAGAFGALTLRDLRVLFSADSNLWAQIQATLRPEDKRRIYDQMRRFRYRTGRQPFAYVYRSQANLYGWNSPGIQKTEIDPGVGTKTVPNRIDPLLNVGPGETQEEESRLFLDGDFQKTRANTFVAIQKAPAEQPKNYRILEAKTFPRTDYGLSGNATRVIIEPETGKDGWWKPTPTGSGGDGFSVLRQARVWCDAEQLQFAEVLLEEEPETEVLALDLDNKLELDEVYPELSTNSRLILEGVRFDAEVGAPGEVFEREVVDVVGVEHKFDDKLYGDRIVTHITLARPLRQEYWRKTVRIHANVIEATHGESFDQVLGSGDGSSPFQRFSLNNAPLTRLPDATPRGSKDELVVRVNGVCWGQTDHIATAKSQEPAYEVGQDREGDPQIQFGDGGRGARLPSGTENVRAGYRSGLGSAGNVDADLINQMTAPPLGAKAVRNPLRASGGTDEDNLEQARFRAGRATMSLDKLVSLDDYRNFALFFAGIDKVEARRQDGKVLLTVAGTDPVPLLKSGSLLRNLRKALRDHGDPTVVVIVEPHEPLLLFVAANVAIDPRYDWETVQGEIRTKLLDRFSYRRSEFGQDILAAELQAAIQGVEGVTFVDLDDLRSLPSPTSSSDPGNLPSTANSGGNANDEPKPVQPRLPVGPHQLCYLDPDVPDMLILEQTS